MINNGWDVDDERIRWVDDVDKVKKKGEIVSDTVELLKNLGATVVRPIEVSVGIYRGCRKIGYSKLVWESGGVIYCIVHIFDGGSRTMMDSCLNSGNILRIYDELKERYGDE